MNNNNSAPEQLTAVLQKIQEIPASELESKKIGVEEEKALTESLETERLRAEIDGLKQDIGERKKYAKKSFKLVSHWILGVFLLLIFQGFFAERCSVTLWSCKFDFAFKLADSVLLAVVGGTTVSIIGIFLVVANYLFPKK